MNTKYFHDVEKYFSFGGNVPPNVCNSLLLHEAYQILEDVQNSRSKWLKFWQEAVSSCYVARSYHRKYSSSFEISLHSLMIYGGTPNVFQRFGVIFEYSSVVDHLKDPERMPIKVGNLSGFEGFNFYLPFEDGHYTTLICELDSYDFMIGYTKVMEKYNIPHHLVVYHNNRKIYECLGTSNYKLLEVCRLIVGDEPLKPLDWRDVQTIYTNVTFKEYEWLNYVSRFPETHIGVTTPHINTDYVNWEYEWDYERQR